MNEYPWSGHMVDRIVYNALRKNFPKPPTVLQSGMLSVARQTEGTTAELFKDTPSLAMRTGNTDYDTMRRHRRTTPTCVKWVTVSS